jgi:tetratricopeptide (TPR) repeat protein
MGGMMGPPRLGPRTPTAFGGGPGQDPAPGRPPGGPGPDASKAARPPGFPFNRSPLGSGPANRGGLGPGGRPELGRAVDPHHASWYHGNGSNSSGGNWDKAADKAGDYVDRERARDYAAGAAWGLGASGYSSGYSGYGDSGYSSSSGGYGGYGSYSDYGYGDAYVNPYYDASSADGDYSRPVLARVAGQDTGQDGAAGDQADQASDPGADGTKTASDSPSGADRGYQAFDRARDAFKAGDYAAALDLTNAALKDVPGDTVVHEFKALALFARGEYTRAAAALHAVLAVTRGMDWATMIGLYPDVAAYTAQLRALEDNCRRDPKAAASRLVLAYHYLVAGHKDAAVTQLQAVLATEPGDRVARGLLASLRPAPPPSLEPTPPAPGGDGAAGRSPSADLPGRWRGDRGGSTFDLSLDCRGRFVWQAARQGKPTATVSGGYALSGDTLTLKADDRSPLRASVTEVSADSFRSAALGGAASDAGLIFHRVAQPAAPGRDQRSGPSER